MVVKMPQLLISKWGPTQLLVTLNQSKDLLEECKKIRIQQQEN